MNTFKFFLTAIILMQSISVFSQIDSSSKIVNTQFPDSWDKNRDLRNKRGQILAWVHYKSNVYENKICIDFVTGKDSLGRIAYYLSGMHSSKKPFNKWNFMYTRIENYFTSPNGMKFGYWDLHLKEFDHKPSEEELYGLLKKWDFRFLENDPDIVEAGLDDKLWLSVLGFLPDRKRLTATK